MFIGVSVNIQLVPVVCFSSGLLNAAGVAPARVMFAVTSIAIAGNIRQTIESILLQRSIRFNKPAKTLCRKGAENGV